MKTLQWSQEQPRCIIAWFGSVSNFEAHVCGEVRAALVHQLTYDVFSYRRLVLVTSPVAISLLDIWCSRAGRDGQHHAGLILAIVTDWLVS